MHDDDLISRAGLRPAQEAAAWSGEGIRGGLEGAVRGLRAALGAGGLPAPVAGALERLLGGARPPDRGQIGQAMAGALREAAGDAHGGAAGVRDILRMTAESLVGWGKAVGAFTQPEAVRIQVAEARMGMDTAFEQVRPHAAPGEALAPFAEAAQRFADSLGRLAQFLSGPAAQPGLDLHAALAGGVADAARATLAHPAEGTAAAGQAGDVATAARTTRAVLADQLRLEKAGRQAPLITPPPGGYPALEKTSSEMRENLSRISGQLAPRQAQRLEAQVERLLQLVAGQPTMPPLAGRGDLAPVTPQAAMAILNNLFAEIAARMQAPPASSAADAARLGADPDRLRFDPAVLAQLARRLQPEAEPGTRPAGGIQTGLENAPTAAAETGRAAAAMDPAKARELQQKVQSAINDENDGAICDLAKNPEAMQAATPEQKAAMINVLKDGYTSDDEDRAILGILQTATTAEEFYKVFDGAGGVGVINEVEADGVADKIKKLTDDFGPPPLDETQTAELKSKIDQAISDEDDGAINNLAKDPRAMEAATPEQKAAMINILKDGYTSDDDDRGIRDILKSCKDEDEYYQVFEGAGGPDIIDEVEADGVADEIKGFAAKFGPPKLTAEEQQEYQSKIDQAIGDEDDGAIVALSRDPKAMAAATPEQKAKLIEVLKEGHTTDEEDTAIGDILGGCADKAEVEQVIELSGGRDSLMDELDVTGVEDKIDKLCGRPDLVLDRAVSNESDDSIVELAKDPDMMAQATPDQKAGMIKVLMDGWTKNAEDRAILDILESCATPQEFQQVVDKAGGKDVFDEIDLDEVKDKMNLLAGGYGRLDLATDPEKAKQAQGAFLGRSSLMVAGDPRLADPELAGGAGAAGGSAADRFEAASDRAIKEKAYYEISPKVQKEVVMENARRKQEGKAPLDLTQLTAGMEAIRQTPGLSDQMREDKIEALRKKFGLSEDSMRELATGRLSGIYADGAAQAGSLGAEMVSQLEQRYEAVVARSGADSAEAKQLAKELEGLKQATGPYVGRLDDLSTQMESMYPVPKSWEEDFVAAFGSIFDMLSPLLQAIPGYGSLIYAAYVGVKMGTEIADGDIGGFFEQGILGMAGNTVGNMGVGFPPSLEAEIGVYYRMQAQSGINAVTKGDIPAIASLAANALGPIGGAVGGTAGAVLTVAGQVINAGSQVYRGTDAALRGDVLGAISGYGGALMSGVNLAGFDPETVDMISKGVNYLSQGAKAGVGFATGNWQQGLSGLAGLAGGVADLGLLPDLDLGEYGDRILNLLGQGAQFGLNLAGGDYLKALGQLGGAFGDPGLQEWMNSVANDPAIRDVIGMTTAGADVVGKILNGNYSGALQGLVDGLGGLDAAGLQDFLGNATVQEVLGYGQQGIQFFQNLRDGKYGEALGQIGGQLEPLLGGVDLGRSLGFLGQMGGAVQAALNKDVLGLQRYLGQGFGEISPLLDRLGAGEASDLFGRLGGEVGRLLDDPTLRQAAGMLGQGSAFTQSLLRGDFTQALNRLAGMPGLEGLQPAIQKAWGTVANVTPFITDLASGQYLRGLAGLASGGGPLAGSQALREALGAVQGSTGFFAGMTSNLFGTGPRSLWEGLDRLASLPTLTPALAHLENSARQLLQQAGGDPDAAARLLWQAAGAGGFHPPAPRIRG